MQKRTIFDINVNTYMRYINLGKVAILAMRLVTVACFHFTVPAFSQSSHSLIDSFRLTDGVKVIMDLPERMRPGKKSLVIFYALPNGNSTEWTMGKRIQPGDDWHFDIQHIRAQTAFIRQELKRKNVVVVYLENNRKSWPAWKQDHPEFPSRIPQLVDSLAGLVKGRKEIYLNGHSGGGSFIFGYLKGVGKIPPHVRRISFLDSDYGYDSTYYPAIREWLTNDRRAHLNVFAYNDSIALYNGKPVVSSTGGTWYRSRLMLRHLSKDFSFDQEETDSITVVRSATKRIQFFFKPNLNRGIYHTRQVELNGFIHSVLCGTKRDSRRYAYYAERAYSLFIE